MIQDIISEFFFKHPSATPHLRELARKCNISPAATVYVTKQLIKEKVLAQEKKGPLTIFTTGEQFTQKKRIWNLEQLYKTDIIQQLLPAQAIIVFGSFSRGEDWEESDIDMAVIQPKKNVSYNKKIANRTVQVLPITRKLPKELQNNILNGIPLYGRWDPL